VHRIRALCDEDILQAELVFLKDIFKQNGYKTEPSTIIHFRSTGQQAQLSHLSALCQVFIQLNQQSAGPTQHQIGGFVPHEIIQSAPSCQRQHMTEDTRCLQDPLWVQQGLHWAGRPFWGHQVIGVSTAHLTRTSGQVKISWTQCQPRTLPAVPPCIHPDHKNQIHGQHCYGGHCDLTPPLHYE
jgi:hypothetical protein